MYLQLPLLAHRIELDFAACRIRLGTIRGRVRHLGGTVHSGCTTDSSCAADSHLAAGSQRASAPGIGAAVARERFLESHGAPLGVREEIASSWKRSSSWRVRPERAEPPYDPDVDPESRLSRAAAPVLDRLAEQLSRNSLSFLLTDSRARIVDRRVTDHELLDRLDAVRAGRGFVFAEDAVGTNGLGTAVETRQVTEIVGAEHYAEELRQFRCVGVPLSDPMTRRLLGVIDVTCAAERTDPAARHLVEQAARDIDEQLYLQHSRPQRALLRGFLEADRRTSYAIVAIGEGIFITNRRASDLFARMGQSAPSQCAEQAAREALFERADEVVHLRHEVEDTVVLGDDRAIQTRAVPVTDGGDVLGVVLELRCSSNARPRRRTHQLPSVPGLVGRDPTWLKACATAKTASAQRRPVLIVGEPGVGKAALAHALQRDADPGGELAALDAATSIIEGEPSWLRSLRGLLEARPGTVLLRHVELLSSPAGRAAVALLGPAIDAGWRLLATVNGRSPRSPQPLPGLEAIEVELPALRERLEDLPLIVRAFTAPRRASPEVVRALGSLEWPGNLAELRSVLDGAMAATRRDEIGLGDIPAALRAGATRWPLTRFEQSELRTILSSLARTDGNKKEAAEHLGISRATLYRKLRSFGIDLDDASL